MLGSSELKPASAGDFDKRELDLARRELELERRELEHLTLLRLGGGADCARGVKLLCTAQKLLAGIFSNFMTFPDFYSSQSWCNF